MEQKQLKLSSDSVISRFLLSELSLTQNVQAKSFCVEWRREWRCNEVFWLHQCGEAAQGGSHRPDPSEWTNPTPLVLSGSLNSEGPEDEEDEAVLLWVMPKCQPEFVWCCDTPAGLAWSLQD